jgi:DNA polymerase-3 subunit delta'
VTDVLDHVLGQSRAVGELRRHLAHPSHAYLFVGPPGSGLREALVGFAAGLQCENAGCGNCESCRLVLSGADTDVVFVERRGLSWSVDELREAERVGRRRPLGRGYLVVVLENIEFAAAGQSPAMTVLLKSLEDPPARTIYLLTAEEVPSVLSTIESRCVRVNFGPLSDEAVARYLQQDGVDEERSLQVASAASGNLRRAQILVRDHDMEQRLAFWRSVPERLDGTNARAVALTGEILSLVETALEPLVALQEQELAQLKENATAMGQRSLPRRDEIEAGFKREQRRFRIDDLRFGLATLTNVYQERLHSGLETTPPTSRSLERAQGAVTAIEEIAKASRSFSQNVNETLQLTDLFVSLSQS